MTIQVYVGLIPSLLLALWASRKANKRTFTIGLPFFSVGWASEEELLRYLDHPPNKNQGYERGKQCAGHYTCTVVKVKRGDSGDMSPDRVTALLVADGQPIAPYPCKNEV